MNKLHLIGWASGMGGVNATGGDAPQVIQTSPDFAALKEVSVWDAMIAPNPALQHPVNSIQDMAACLAQQTKKLVNEKKNINVIGGDHTSAIGTWSGVYDAIHPTGDLGLIWIDAHMDSHTPETTESGRLHGMPLACLLGHGYPALTSILQQAPKIKPENLCLIGVRSFEKGEAALLARLNVRIYYMDEVKERGFDVVFQEAIHHVKQNTCAYGVSLDLDAIDPHDAPGVDVPEPDGISVNDLYAGIESAAKDPAWIATEIVEFDPHRDKDHTTERVVIHLLTIIARAKCDYD